MTHTTPLKKQETAQQKKQPPWSAVHSGPSRRRSTGDERRLIPVTKPDDLARCRSGRRDGPSVVVLKRRSDQLYRDRRHRGVSPLVILRGSAARSRRQETDGGQRCLRHSSHVANPAGGSSMGSLPSSSPGVGMSMLAAHSASSSSDMGHVVCGASAWR